jgi:hypothetical protein
MHAVETGASKGLVPFLVMFRDFVVNDSEVWGAARRRHRGA